MHWGMHFQFVSVQVYGLSVQQGRRCTFQMTVKKLFVFLFRVKEISTLSLKLLLKTRNHCHSGKAEQVLTRKESQQFWYETLPGV